MPYAASGTFAINMWIKAKKPAKGVGFEYIFSHMQEGAEAGIRSASQVCAHFSTIVVFTDALYSYYLNSGLQ